MPRKQSRKYEESRSLYERGLSVGEVAEFYGISRQAMWSILDRRGTQFRSFRKHGKENHFYRGGPRAHKYSSQAVERAIKKRILVPQPCEVCGVVKNRSDGQRDVVAHHDDYNKPLDVRWLCKVHHAEWHKTHKAIPWARFRSKRPSRGRS